ncbi:MAG: glycosyl hydrolase 53 family protein [Clostridia bacterium]|nr:glycosyl hydrolase 53 family protein [Clostridia bacterium]
MMKAIKKLISIAAILLALCLLFTASACNKNKDDGGTSDGGGGTDIEGGNGSGNENGTGNDGTGTEGGNSETTVSVMSVELARSTYTLYTENDEGYASTYTLSYTVMYTDLSMSTYDESAVWRSSDPTVATVESTEAGGVVTALKAGTAMIRVTVGGVSATCTFTVVDTSTLKVRDTGISVSPTKATITSLDETVQLTAAITPENVSEEYATVEWSSFNEAIATVDQNGLVTPVAGGSVTIQAKSASGYTAVAVITIEGEDIEEAETQLYVGAVSALNTRSEDASSFIMGMDASEVISIEEARAATTYTSATGATVSKDAEVAYKNFDGEEEDVFQIIKDNGITDVRVRIWNDPEDADGNTYGGGNCDLDNAVEIAKRCEKAGLGLIVDFHYSDFWADPAKQTVPKSWSGYSTEQIKEAIGTFTKDSLEKIKETGVSITMVQIGNETTGYMCGSKDWSTICSYMNAGSAAVREVTGTVADGGAKVAVHFTNAGYNVLTGYAGYLDTYNVDYDVFGTSWYPYYSSHGTLSNCTAQLKSIHDSYNKEVMVLETAYAYAQDDFDGTGNTSLETTTQPITVQGQSNAVRDVIEGIAGLGDYGLGVCYWGGLWIPASTSASGSVNRAICKEYGCGWATSYASGYDSDANDGGSQVDNQTFFYADGTPLESLKVFSLVYTGQYTTITVDYSATQEVYCEVNSGAVEMPESVPVILNNGQTQTLRGTDIIWDVTEDELAQYIQTPDLYVISGTTSYGGTITCNVWVTYPNMLDEGSFEEYDAYADGESGTHIGTGDIGPWVATNKYSASAELQLYVSNNENNARMGTQSFHFWDSTTVEFTLEQTIDVSKLTEAGYYTASFDIAGGDSDPDTTLIYVYVNVTFSDGTTTSYDNKSSSGASLDGWQVWTSSTLTGIDLSDLSSVSSITYGIYVYAPMEVGGSGAWGNIDNCQFYYAG